LAELTDNLAHTISNILLQNSGLGAAGHANSMLVQLRLISLPLQGTLTPLMRALGSTRNVIDSAGADWAGVMYVKINWVARISNLFAKR
jgi:hypothetical protein